MSSDRIPSPTSASLEASFDVIVVGGGHAGTEAAVAAARCGAQVALITGALEQIGQLSCNPAIGGIAKGTVVREVDALGGIMARATDLASVQFRMLNRGKGPAVWAPRAQCDRGLYRRAVRTLLEAQPNLLTMQGMVARLLFDENARDGDRRVAGVETAEGRRFGARAVVLTTGTFGRGTMHIGTGTRISGGRAGEAPSVMLGEQLDAVGLDTARFKTGTPPRIDGRSVCYGTLEQQDSEIEAFDYSWSHFWTTPRVTGNEHGVRSRHPVQMPCWITWLEGHGTQLIADHIAESAMYGGAIASRGPRYCPSVEDKVVKFPDKHRHQLFLEPEGHDTTELYVNGLSTSLPAPVQLEVMRTVAGLENVRMTRAGYAIEYDYYPPTQLDASLASRAIRGLYFAGQVNGTTGYEEAAGQGVIAGINAARNTQAREPLVLGRETSYIAVLVNDLVTRGVDEPYRLFTSRSEFRLTVRQDNALARLGPIAEREGLLSDGERAVMATRLEAVREAIRLAERTSMPPEIADPVLEAVGSRPLLHAVRAAELAKRQDVSLQALLEAVGVGADLPGDAVVGAELEIKYAGYFEKERSRAARLEAQGMVRLPAHLEYESLLTLSTEARQKLARLRPGTLAQASAIPGISPADLQNLLMELRKARASI
ncbi:tRNA uridine-5-carboxymethylaminomethyl(34) synthesis enzyme MnmG [Gemmatimonas sp.]|uniref:tRNA uridine-5-carboxymethylaminomethyl(34) synthesis enzyme MnmG n=1 Tax=Gemmatimonas sp. TaxID=1962908 RepID=UPI0022C85BE1|nr:tRNA uridine-5-carboxymethylaminomethyl(34) synthesis enzyme MnmG [Gemmatimonas sp.]MCZ8206284.1 tRNA uridine-5-carboxymethylaminomethyl(34) synthesis enzyme MnmG [Gemmatimonas sp.]